MPKKEKVVRKKALVVGDKGVGKASMLVRYTQDIFTEAQINTVFQTCCRNEQVGNNTKVELALWLTNPDDGYEPLREVAYQGTDVAIMCFGLDKPHSFENITKKWIPEMKNNGLNNVKLVVIGTRSDLADDPLVQQELVEAKLRPVTKEQGNALAQQIGAYCYIECSSKTGLGVKEVFHAAAKASVHKSKKSSSCVIL